MALWSKWSIIFDRINDITFQLEEVIFLDQINDLKLLKEIILTETNDLSYFNKSIHLLKSLEKVAYARNERLRIYHEKIRSIRAIVAGMLASILSTAIWIFIMLSLELSYFDLQTTGKFVTRLVALLLTIALLIILPYFVFIQNVASSSFSIFH